MRLIDELVTARQHCLACGVRCVDMHWVSPFRWSQCMCICFSLTGENGSSRSPMRGATAAFSYCDTCASVRTPDSCWRVCAIDLSLLQLSLIRLLSRSQRVSRARKVQARAARAAASRSTRNLQARPRDGAVHILYRGCEGHRTEPRPETHLRIKK